MRRIRLALALVSVIGVVSVLGQSDPLAAIRQALTAKYTLTTATADKTAIVTAGSLLALKKSDLLAAAVTGAIVVSNSYRYGKVRVDPIEEFCSPTMAGSGSALREELITWKEVASHLNPRL